MVNIFLPMAAIAACVRRITASILQATIKGCQ